MDFGRRESVVTVPGADSVLDALGRVPGPTERRDFPYNFRLHVSDGDLDAAWDRVLAQIAPGVPQRLVYQTDSGALWYTTAYNGQVKHVRKSTDRYGTRGELDFGLSWRIRPDWRLRYPEAATARDTYSPADSEVYSASDDDVYTGDGVVVIASATQSFTLDATGTAGLDLPTIPDTDATFFITGPAGGDGGIAVTTYSAFRYDTAGAKQPVQFTLPWKLPSASDSYAINLASQSFWCVIGGVTKWFRPFRQPYQGIYFEVTPGIVNNCTISALGANPVTGGYAVPTWWKKRA